ncbi:MAG: hypothetical protein CMB82_01430 [Flammeovirgaceae bacterium]|nr:hypothetical protein [Flammeovirgaceae bacterium]|tara:strand:+ start:1882 stop:3300 length:1419 start_codon:yes stop_codon:yes gene_type:complete
MFRVLFPKNKSIFKEIIFLSYPVVLSNVSRVLMSIFDVAMVGRLGPEALAATGMGGMLVWAPMSIALGIRTAVQTVSSRRLGQKKETEAGLAFHNGLIMAAVFGVPVTILGWGFSDTIVPFFLTDAKTISLAIDYTSIVFISLLFSVFGFVFVGFFTGIEKTKFHMTVTIVSNLINLYLNAALIYGSDGIEAFFKESGSGFSFLSVLWGWTTFPALGVKGAAIATLVASIWMMFHYFIYLFSKDIKTVFEVFSFSFDWPMMQRQLRLAVPMGVQECIIAFGWTCFLKIVGIIGILELATTHIIFTIMHASFMPAMGIGMACSTLVSKYMGEKKIHKSVDSIKESVRLAEYGMGTLGVSFIIFPEFYLSIFTSDKNIIEMGKVGLQVVGGLQFLDAVGFVLLFALIGAGNTVFPAVVESLLVWTIVVFGTYFLGVYLDYGFSAPWILFPVYMFLFAGIMTWKVLQGDWKNIEV